MEAMIRFLQGIPQFGGADGGKEENLDPDIKKKKTCTWTKTALSRLSYYFKKVHYRRSNIVYKERDPCKFVYLVYEGEFEISKTVFFKEKDEDQFDHSQYLYTAPKDPFLFTRKPKSEAPVPKIQKIKNKTKQFNVQVKLLGAGQIISEDAVNKTIHTKTFKCKSLHGTLLEMPVEDFYQRIKRDHEDTWKLI